MRQFMAFKRRNGVLPGMFSGVDSIPAMLAPGEIVLNPKQQDRVRANAGMDPFRGAGIPGYSGGSGGQSTVVNAGPVTVQVYMEQDSTGVWTATAKSPDGQKVITEIVQDKFRNGGLDTKRRGI